MKVHEIIGLPSIVHVATQYVPAPTGNVTLVLKNYIVDDSIMSFSSRRATEAGILNDTCYIIKSALVRSKLQNFDLARSMSRNMSIEQDNIIESLCDLSNDYILYSIITITKTEFGPTWVIFTRQQMLPIIYNNENGKTMIIKYDGNIINLKNGGVLDPSELFV